PAPAPGPAQAQPIRSLPAPCGMVPHTTVRQIVPDAKQSKSANSTLTTCTYTAPGREARWLRVEAHLHLQMGATDPVKNAQDYYNAQWTQARAPQLERTITLEPQPDMGDQAYRWFKVDKGQPTVVGVVTARIRNVVVTVSYSEQAVGKGEQEEREGACMAKVMRTAREVLRSLH
ncbi:hypothetical protein, partial [Actinomadura rubrisoli]|uniref:hypothetical protein n=1 Tax=Actinomadura rubrisoli TaxID=2530368 RepID=UPI0014055403